MAEEEIIQKTNEIPGDTKPTIRSWWKRIVRFLIWLSLFTIFLIVVLVVLTYIYRDEVKGYVISEVNKRVNTIIIINPEDIDLTIIRTFPDMSVVFKNISMLDATTQAERDTMLKAKSVSLGFNIMDLFKSNYSIHSVTVENAAIAMWVDTNGNDNYHFLKENTDTIKKDTSHVKFAIEQIIFKDVICSYKDKKKQSTYKADFQELYFTGNFEKEKYDFKTEAEFIIKEVRSSTASYFKGDKGSLDLNMAINQSSKKYEIKTGVLKINDLVMDISGNIVEKRDQYLLDLKIKGDEVDLPSALSLLPTSYKEDIADLESTGEFYIDATVKGLYGDSIVPNIIAKFGIKNGATLKRKNFNAALSDISMSGEFNNIKGKDGIRLNSFKASSARSKFNGSFSITSLDHPYYQADIKGRIDIEELQNILQIDTIEKISGILDVELKGAGSPAVGNSFTAKDFRTFKTSGSARFTETQIKLKGASYAIDSINGKLNFDGNNVEVVGFKAQALKSNVMLDGKVQNLLGYLFTEQETLDISGSFSSKLLDLNELLYAGTIESKNNTPSTNYNLVLPARLNLNLNTNIKNVFFRKFEASDIIGAIQLKNQRLTADPIVFNTMSGKISGSGMIDGTRKDSLLITCNATIQKVNIYKLFYELENFGQEKDTTITYNNVRGVLTAQVNYAAIWGIDLNVNENKIYAAATISITNGQLKNFSPLESLSRFIKLDDLKDIQFKSLKNTIEIKNRIITMPKMEINSSAINISMSGSHDFDNNVDYRFIVDLDEIRAKKANSQNPKNEEFGVEEKGEGHRTRLFISMKGYIDNPTIKYDQKGAVQGIKEDLKQEKQNLKAILQDEFGWFKEEKKAGNNKDRKKEELDQKFILEQDDTPKIKKKKGEEKLEDEGDYE